MLARAFSAASKSPARAHAPSKILYIFLSSVNSRSCMSFKTLATPFKLLCTAYDNNKLVNVYLFG